MNIHSKPLPGNLESLAQRFAANAGEYCRREKHQVDLISLLEDGLVEKYLETNFYLEADHRHSWHVHFIDLNNQTQTEEWRFFGRDEMTIALARLAAIYDGFRQSDDKPGLLMQLVESGHIVLNTDCAPAPQPV